MTLATLYREGDDLDALLVELDSEHAGQVRVVSVTYPRDGGVLGFFARQRVGVHYELDAAGSAGGSADFSVDFAAALGRPEPARHVAQPTARAASYGDPFADLIEAAEEAESESANRRAAARVPAAATTGESPATNAEFAQMVLDLAARKSAGRAAAPVAATALPTTETPSTEPTGEPGSAHVASQFPSGSLAASVAQLRHVEPAQFPTVSRNGFPVAASFTPAPVLQTPPAFHVPAPNHVSLNHAAIPAVAPAPVGLPLAASVIAPASVGLLGNRLPAERRAGPRHAAPDDNRTQLTLRRKLAEVGVPIEWVPDSSADTYRVVEELVSRLPEPPAAPSAARDVLVIAGPAGPALRAAETLRLRLRLDVEQVWTAGCASSAPERTITDARHARTVSADARLSAHQATIVVVAFDDHDEHGHEVWATDIIRALCADALWVVVDARRKPSDTRAQLALLGTPDALIVTSAERSASPASVWHIGVPTALLDGRPATRGTWAVLLIDKLAGLEP